MALNPNDQARDSRRTQKRKWEVTKQEISGKISELRAKEFQVKNTPTVQHNYFDSFERSLVLLKELPLQIRLYSYGGSKIPGWAITFDYCHGFQHLNNCFGDDPETAICLAWLAWKDAKLK